MSEISGDTGPAMKLFIIPPKTVMEHIRAIRASVSFVLFFPVFHEHLKYGRGPPPFGPIFVLPTSRRFLGHSVRDWRRSMGPSANNPVGLVTNMMVLLEAVGVSHDPG